jgi:hypothetical protein
MAFHLDRVFEAGAAPPKVILKPKTLPYASEAPVLSPYWS